MGCHVALNYKDRGFQKAFKEVGLIDVYFDNGESESRSCFISWEQKVDSKCAVGGEILDMVLRQMQHFARIIACGAISSYNTKEPYALKNTPALIAMKAKIQGFIAMDYSRRYPEARAYLADLKKRDKLSYEYTMLEPRQHDKNGLGRCVEGMHIVAQGKNVGKT